MSQPPDAAGPARLWCLLAGLALLLGGIGGFFYEAGFETGDSLAPDDIFGVFPTAGWDNALHAAAGLLALGIAPRAPRPTALALGALLTVLGLWGLAAAGDGTGTIAGLLPVDRADSLLHLAAGALGIGAAALPPDRLGDRR